MPLVFTTPKDSTGDVEIVGAGVAKAGAVGGVAVEQAAANGMVALQKKGEHGELVLDDRGAPTPLSGKALEKAAREFVADRDDLDVTNLSEAKIAKLPEETGVAADRPPAAEVAEEDYNRVYGEGADVPDLEEQAEVSAPEPVPADEGKE